MAQAIYVSLSRSSRFERLEEGYPPLVVVYFSRGTLPKRAPSWGS